MSLTTGYVSIPGNQRILQRRVTGTRTVSQLNTWWRHEMEKFSALLAICAGIHRSPVNSPHKGQWRRALMFSLICVWINGWVNNREAGDLRRYRAHYDVIVMNNDDVYHRISHCAALLWCTSRLKNAILELITKLVIYYLSFICYDLPFRSNARITTHVFVIEDVICTLSSSTKFLGHIITSHIHFRCWKCVIRAWCHF